LNPSTITINMTPKILSLLCCLIVVTSGHVPDPRPVFPAHAHHSHSPIGVTHPAQSHSHPHATPSHSSSIEESHEQVATRAPLDADHTSHAPVTNCLGCSMIVQPTRSPHNHHTHAADVKTFRPHNHHSHGPLTHRTVVTHLSTTTRPHNHHTHRGTGNRRPIYVPHVHHDHEDQPIQYGPCQVYSSTSCQLACQGVTAIILNVLCYNNCCAGVMDKQ